MEKELNYKKVIIAAIIGLIVIAGLFTGIAKLVNLKRPFSTEKFYDLLNNDSYNRAYSNLSEATQLKYNKNDFEKYYKDTMQAIGGTKIRVENVNRYNKGASQYVDCEIIYETKNFGELKEQHTLQLTQDGLKLEWSPSNIFNDMEKGDSIKVSTNNGKRGEIFAADDSLLVGNTYAVSIFATPAKITDQNAFAKELAPLIQMKEEEVIARLNSTEAQRDDIVIIKSFLPKEYDSTNSKKILAINGADIDTDRLIPIREYPANKQGVHASHILGYTSVVTAQDLEKDPSLQAGVLVGRQGIEQKYDKELQPKLGFEVFISAENKQKKKVIYKEEAKNGLDIHLTINPALQKQAEDSLALNTLEKQKGCVVVLDAKTGDVEAMASFPTFDPYTFSKPLSEEQWKVLNDPNGGQPLFNRAVSGLYPPGSTVKPFTAAIAWDNKVVGKEYVFDGKVENNNWKPNIKNWMWPPITRYRNHNSLMNLTNSMIYSDNIYFADLALKTGAVNFMEGMQNFGFTTNVPFQLQTSTSRLANEGTEMNYKLLADTGYGQGEFLTTPLQLATSYTVFLNQGNMLQPNLVSSIYQAEGKNYTLIEKTQPAVWKEKAMDPYAVSILDQTLKETTQRGTGMGAGISELQIYGKTGTAEVGPNLETEISWYVGYTKDPAKIILVMIECDPKEGSAIKNHIVKDMIYGIIGKPIQGKINEIPKESSDR